MSSFLAGSDIHAEVIAGKAETTVVKHEINKYLLCYSDSNRQPTAVAFLILALYLKSSHFFMCEK